MNKAELIQAFRSLGIEELEHLSDLNSLPGHFINLEYTLPSGQAIRVWDDNKTYLGNEVCKKGSDRCYGLASDGIHLLVCEYGAGGTNAEIIIFKKL